MHRTPKAVPAGGSIVTFCAFINAILHEQTYTGHTGDYHFLCIILPLLAGGLILLRAGQVETPVKVIAHIKSLFR